MLAPTGVAAVNINGSTIHSGLIITCKSGLFPLNDKNRAVLRNKYSRVEIIIIDEIYMISRKLMYQIHKCLTKYLVFPRTAFLVENQYFSVETFISCHRFKLSPSLGVMKHVHLKQLLV